jgi:hypothetical protein
MTRLLTMALLAGTVGFGALPGTTASAIVPLPPPARRPAPAGWTYRWVPPVYTTQTQRVWVEGTSEWVVDYLWRDGRYEQVWRRVTTPGHWENRTERVEVRPGYWQLVRIEPPPPPVSPPIYRPYPMPRPWQPGAPTVGVEGYQRGPGEDLGEFSPLREWPAR